MEQAADNERQSLPNPFTLPSFSYDKWHYMSLFDPERWYDELKDFTFATAFMPVSKAHAAALVHHYQKHQLRRTDAFTPEDETHMAQLEAALFHEMEEMRRQLSLSPGHHQDGFFVRLSSRSPKDAGLNEGHPQIMEFLSQEIDRFGGVDVADPNQKTVALQRAAGRILRVTDAKQALERTYSDLVHALGHEEGEWTMKLVLRHWMDGVDLANEFRGFVCEGRLTALSQYNDGNFYPELMGKEEVIVSKISDYWRKVTQHVKYQACIVDFVLVNDMQDVYVVEINPFGPVTGGALFEWSTERPLLQGGHDVWGDLQTLPKRRPEPEDEDKNEDGEEEEDDGAEERLRYREYRSEEKAEDGEPRPVLRLVHKAPSYLNEDYLMAFPILEQVVQYQHRRKATEKGHSRKEAACTLQ